MPDDQNLTQNPISEENSIPASPQEPMADTPVSTPDPTPAEMPLEAPETSINADIPISLNNDNPQNEPISTPNPEEVKPEELPAEGGKIEGITPVLSEPLQTPEPRTAQIPVNEPFGNTQDKPLESVPVSTPQPQSVSDPIFAEPQQNKISLARELLVKARNMIQFRKRKKLDRVMSLFLQRSKITNDEVEKFLHVSDATATRYLSQLEKEGKIKQSGKTGKAVSYSRI
ncbi:MAG: hypothetical protein WC735_00125 [Candidatus Paceibacterota bacterium]|jgi:hypothetical protein